MAIEAYAEHLAAKSGNATRSNATTISRLRAFLAPVRFDPADSVTPKKAAKIYDRYCETPTRFGRPPSATTHRNTLKQTRTFFRWAIDQGFARVNPFAEVKLVGRERKGKPPVRIDEARKLYATCLEDGSPGALATLIVLVLGLRATETVRLTAREIDDAGRVLWIDDTKTDAGKRALEVPDGDVADLLRRTADDADGGRLFPGRTRDWLYRECKRLAKLARIETTSPQALRAAHSTLAQRRGVTAAVVADALGHAGDKVTREHYTAPGVAESAQARRVFGVIAGGRS